MTTEENASQNPLDGPFQEIQKYVEKLTAENSQLRDELTGLKIREAIFEAMKDYRQRIDQKTGDSGEGRGYQEVISELQRQFPEQRYEDLDRIFFDVIKDYKVMVNSDLKREYRDVVFDRPSSVDYKGY
ncbi:hypothetical protein GCM10027299_09310 [Larkinella ripae]